MKVYRGTETVETLRSVKTDWAYQATIWGGFVPDFLTARSYGAGEQVSGTREIAVASRADLRERDGLEVVTGPEDGTKWRVIDIDRGDKSQWKVRVESFAGTFT